MDEKYKMFQKKYPIVVITIAMLIFILFVCNIILYAGGKDFGEKIFLADIIEIISCVCVPLFCIVICIITIVKFRKLSINRNITYQDYIRYSLEIKRSYVNVYGANFFVGLGCALAFYLSTVTLALFIMCLAMLFQTGFISAIGIKKLYKSGMINRSDYIKYAILQFVLFRDIESLEKICKKYSE